MGTRSIFFSRAHGRPTGRSSEAQSNRALLTQSMRKPGFGPTTRSGGISTLRHEPYPETYFVSGAVGTNGSPASRPALRATIVASEP